MPLTVTGNSATVLFINEALTGLNVPANGYYTQRGNLDAGYSVASYVNDLTAFGFRTASDATLATVVLDHLLGHDPANTPTLAASVTALLTANPGNRGVVVLQLAVLLSGKEGDPVYGAAAAAWNARINADLRVQLSDPGPRNYNLTPGLDDITGTPGGDSFVAAGTSLNNSPSLNTGDKLDGGAGGDTLSLYTRGAQVAQFTGFTATSVETLRITSDASGGSVVSLAGMPDATSLINYGSSTDVSFTNLGHRVDLTLANVSSGKTTLAFAPEVVKGNADTLDVALINNQANPFGPVNGLYVNGIEVMNINTSGGSSRTTGSAAVSVEGPVFLDIGSSLAEIASPGSLAVLNISGDEDLTVGKVDFYGAGNTGLVNAAALTGRLTLGLGTQGGADASMRVLGGANVDTLRLAGNPADYSLQFSTGTGATNHLHNLHASSAQVGNLDFAGVERLRFDNVSLALDVRPDQAGGKAAEMLGAVLGLAGLNDKANAGWLLTQFDKGVTLLGVAQLLLNNGYLAGKAGAASAADAPAIVRYVYTNVHGQAPLPTTLDALLAPITSHTTTLAQWVADMAASSDNQVHVQLTGYLQNGLAYA